MIMISPPDLIFCKVENASFKCECSKFGNVLWSVDASSSICWQGRRYRLIRVIQRLIRHFGGTLRGQEVRGQVRTIARRCKKNRTWQLTVGHPRCAELRTTASCSLSSLVMHSHVSDLDNNNRSPSTPIRKQGHTHPIWAFKFAPTNSIFPSWQRKCTCCSINLIEYGTIKSARLLKPVVTVCNRSQCPFPVVQSLPESWWIMSNAVCRWVRVSHGDLTHQHSANEYSRRWTWKTSPRYQVQ